MGPLSAFQRCRFLAQVKAGFTSRRLREAPTGRRRRSSQGRARPLGILAIPTSAVMVMLTIGVFKLDGISAALNPGSFSLPIFMTAVVSPLTFNWAGHHAFPTTPDTCLPPSPRDGCSGGPTSRVPSRQCGYSPLAL